MNVSIRKLFSRKAAYEARLPGQEVAGELLPDSPTWIYIQSWALKELQRVRESNDSVKRTNEETFANRGEIRCLKKLIDLPKDSVKRGLLQSVDSDDRQY